MTDAPTKTATEGISPKVIAAVIAAILGYLGTQNLVDFPAWADLLVQVSLVGIAAFSVGPGKVTEKPA